MTTGYKLSAPTTSMHQKMTTTQSGITYAPEEPYKQVYDNQANRPGTAVPNITRPVTAVAKPIYFKPDARRYSGTEQQRYAKIN